MPRRLMRLILRLGSEVLVVLCCCGGNLFCEDYGGWRERELGSIVLACEKGRVFFNMRMGWGVVI